LKAGDGKDLLALALAIAEAPDSQLQAQVAKLADWQHLLAVFATEAVATDVDGLLVAGNNYELYGDPATGLLHVIRGGADEVFWYASDPFAPWTAPATTCPQHQDDLFARITAIPGLKAQLAARMQELHCGALGKASLAWVQQQMARVAKELPSPLPGGWTVQQQQAATDELVAWLTDRSKELNALRGPCAL
jgi:hypothetical protein